MSNRLHRGFGTSPQALLPNQHLAQSTSSWGPPAPPEHLPPSSTALHIPTACFCNLQHVHQGGLKLEYTGLGQGGNQTLVAPVVVQPLHHYTTR